MNQGDYLLQRDLRRTLDALDAPGSFNPIHGGQVMREHLFTPAGLLIPSQWANLLANPPTVAFWERIIPSVSRESPGAYL